MTIGVYGLVAGIVKLDDAGLWLSRKAAAWQQALGRGLLWLAPWLMKALSVAGTAAMFLVGGGILTHGAPFLHHAIQHVVEGLGVSGFARTLVELLGDAIAGILAGIVVVAVVTGIQRLRHRRE